MQVPQAGLDPAVRQSRGGQKRQGFPILSFRKSERGQDSVEFAVVMLLLFPLLFGVVDLGRFFHAGITIANAAREGAQYLSLYHGESNAARKQVVLDTQGTGITLTTENVSISCLLDANGNCQRMQPAQVTVTYQYQLLLGQLLPGMGSHPGMRFSIQSTAEMLVQ